MTDLSTSSSNHKDFTEKHLGYLLLIPLVLCIVVVVLALMGPAVGNVFSNIVSNAPMPPDGYAVVPAAAPAAAQPVKAQAPERMIIHEGQIEMVVEDTRQAKEQIDALVSLMENQGAFVVSSDEAINNLGLPPTIQMVIRVPAKSFGQTMDKIAALGEQVQGRSEVAQDITEDYYDQQERLKTMETALERLRQIMANAKTVEELLKVEELVTKREAEIEAIKGKLEYLSRSSALSRIEISLRPLAPEPEEIPEPVWEPSETAQRALDDLKHSVQNALDALLYIVIAIVPWVLVISLIVYGGWRVYRKLYRPYQPERERTEQD